MEFPGFAGGAGIPGMEGFNIAGGSFQPPQIPSMQQAPVMATGTTGQPSSIDAGGQGNILGMTPAQFGAVAGGLGAAISPKDSWQQNVGTFAQGLGTTQLAAIANQKKAKADQAYFSTLMEKYPDMMARMIAQSGNPGAPINPANPAKG